MERIPIFALRSILYPAADLGIHVFEQRYKTLVAGCLESGEGFGVAQIRSGPETGPCETFGTGTFARISAHARLPDGRYLLEVEGNRRFRIHGIDRAGAFPMADVSWVSDPIGDFGRAREAGEQVSGLFELYLYRMGEQPVCLPVDPVHRSYVVAAALLIEPEEKQSLLEAPSADVRLASEAAMLRRQLAVMDPLGTTGSS